MILSLHELELAEKISDRILCVNGRAVDRIGTPEKVMTAGYITELYGIRMGSYDEGSSDMELAAPEGTPQVFVIAGRMIQTLALEKGISLENGVWEDYRTIKERQYDKLADTLREYLRMEEIYGMLREARIL